MQACCSDRVILVMTDTPSQCGKSEGSHCPTRGDFAASIATLVFSLAYPVLYGHGIGPAGVFALQCAPKLIIGKADPSVTAALLSVVTLVTSTAIVFAPLIRRGMLRRTALLVLSVALAAIVISLGYSILQPPRGNPLQDSVPFSIPMIVMVLVNAHRLIKSLSPAIGT